MIRYKALRICDVIVAEDKSLAVDLIHFKASKGWFERFKSRRGVRHLTLHGEAASADSTGAMDFLATFQDIIKTGGYVAEQVYNMDETGLVWKKMPRRTFVAKKTKAKRGPKAEKQRITIVFCANASGTHVITPLVINKTLTPRAFKQKNTEPESIGVKWAANSRAWMTQQRCRLWFKDVFVPEVEKHLFKNNLSFKALLLLDNAPGHPNDLAHPNVSVQFLPPNTTSLIQPQDQGTISVFKTADMRYSLQHIIFDILSSSYHLRYSLQHIIVPWEILRTPPLMRMHLMENRKQSWLLGSHTISLIAYAM